MRLRKAGQSQHVGARTFHPSWMLMRCRAEAVDDSETPSER